MTPNLTFVEVPRRGQAELFGWPPDATHIVIELIEKPPIGPDGAPSTARLF